MITFKEFFAKQNYITTPQMPDLAKELKRPKVLPAPNLPKGPTLQKPPSMLGALGENPLLKQIAPSKPTEFLKRGSGLSPTTKKGFQA